MKHCYPSVAQCEGGRSGRQLGGMEKEKGVGEKRGSESNNCYCQSTLDGKTGS